jgi:hypothetical protein
MMPEGLPTIIDEVLGMVPPKRQMKPPKPNKEKTAKQLEFTIDMKTKAIRRRKLGAKTTLSQSP